MKKMLACLVLPAISLGGETVGDRLDWLVGCWSTPDGSAQEVWAPDSNGGLAGFNVVLNDNKVVFYELLTVRANEKNFLVYTASPSNQATTSFVAESAGENSVVFRNPQHDYPQQIAYTRDGDRLDATISLLGGEDPNTFSKVACRKD